MAMAVILKEELSSHSPSPALLGQKRTCEECEFKNLRTEWTMVTDVDDTHLCCSPQAVPSTEWCLWIGKGRVQLCLCRLLLG